VGRARLLVLPLPASHIVLLSKPKPKPSSVNMSFTIPTELLGGSYSEEMKLAVRLALKAGENMSPYLESKGTVVGSFAESSLDIITKKNEVDFCTKIDLVNEDLITNAINEKYPNHCIIGEESTGTGKPASLTNSPTWIIDPIDGTTNFASGLPFTCVSIGFCDGGEPVMGVVFSPKTCELYLAMKGLGSYRNGHRIFSTSCEVRSSDKKDGDTLPEKKLSNSVVCFELGYPRSEDAIDNMLLAVKRVMLHGCRTMRSYGSGVLDLCYVSSGRLDVVYTGVDEEGWSPWDYCAAMVVVEEAGGIIRSLKDDKQKFNEFDKDGKLITESKFDIYSSSMICGVNRIVVEECRNVILGL